MGLQLYNTQQRSKEVFEPIDPQRITMYVCGPTVYNRVHIGNARPAVVFDTLFRLLKSLYPNVIYARNITDIEPTLLDASAEQVFQFEREGYFVADRHDFSREQPVFNKTIGLRDSWPKQEQG